MRTLTAASASLWVGFAISMPPEFFVEPADHQVNRKAMDEPRNRADI